MVSQSLFEFERENSVFLFPFLNKTLLGLDFLFQGRDFLFKFVLQVLSLFELTFFGLDENSVDSLEFLNALVLVLNTGRVVDFAEYLAGLVVLPARLLLLELEFANSEHFLEVLALLVEPHHVFELGLVGALLLAELLLEVLELLLLVVELLEAGLELLGHAVLVADPLEGLALVELDDLHGLDLLLQLLVPLFCLLQAGLQLVHLPEVFFVRQLHHRGLEVFLQLLDLLVLLLQQLVFQLYRLLVRRQLLGVSLVSRASLFLE